MKKLGLREDSDVGEVINYVEAFFDDYGIQITGSNLRLVIDGEDFHIGRDSDSFPRFLEEPIWRYDETDQ